MSSLTGITFFCALDQCFFKEGWTLKPLAVLFKSIKLGPQTVKTIDLAEKIIFVRSSLCYLHLDFVRHFPVQTWFVYFPLSVQPLSTYFALVSGGMISDG